MSKEINRAALESALDSISGQSEELKARVCGILKIGDGECTPEKIDATLNAAGAHELAARLKKVLQQE